MTKLVNKLTKEMFEDIVVFSVSEAGTMGFGDMTFYKKDGNSFTVNCKSENTPYSKLKEYFTALGDCCFDGHMKNEAANGMTVIMDDSAEDKKPQIPNGWRHICLDCGNYLVVKRELYYEVKKIFFRKDNCDITLGWVDMLEEAKLAERIEEIEIAFTEQEKADEILASKLDELQKNAEYIKRMNEASGDVDKMMDVLEEFSGIRMTFLELKQFGFRRSGLI